MIGLVASWGMTLGLASAEPLTLPVERFTLDNGMRVVVHADHHAPTVTTHMIYDAGTLDESATQRHTARLLEFMMRHGSRDVPEYAHTWYVEQAGGESTSRTLPERTEYVHTVPAHALEGVLWLEAERMGHLTFSEAARQRAWSELTRQSSELGWTTGAFDNDAFSRAFVSLAGEPSPSLPSVQAFAEAHYGPNHATLILVGPIDTARTRDLVTKYFAPLAAHLDHDDAASRPDEPPRTQPSLATIDAHRLASLSIVMAWDIPAIRDRDRPALDVLATLLDRRWRSDTARPRIASTAELDGTTGPSQFVVYAHAPTTDDPAELRRLVINELSEIASGNVSSREVERAVAALMQRRARELTSTRGRAAAIARAESRRDATNGPALVTIESPKVDADAIVRVARRWLGDQQSVTVVQRPVRLPASAPRVGDDDHQAADETGAATPTESGTPP